MIETILYLVCKRTGKRNCVFSKYVRIRPFPKFTDQEIVSKIWLFDKTRLRCGFYQRFYWVGIFFTWYSNGPYPLLFSKTSRAWFNKFAHLRIKPVMSAIISSYLTLSKGSMENQNSGLQNTKKWEKNWNSCFFQKFTCYSLPCCKNDNFGTICQRIYELLPDYLKRQKLNISIMVVLLFFLRCINVEGSN